MNDYRSPQWLKDSGNFGIVVFGDAYFAIPKSLGDIRLEQIDICSYPQILVRGTLKEVEDAAIETDTRSIEDLHPRFIRAFRDCNIVFHCGQFHGVPTSLGNIRLEDNARAADPKIVRGSTLEEVEIKITERWLRDVPDGVPIMVREHPLYNVVFFSGLYYGIPKAWGDFHLDRGDNAGRSGLLKSATVAGINAQVTEAEQALKKPRIVSFVSRLFSGTGGS